MGRIKKKDWKMASFSLDKLAIDKLEEIAKFEGISKAEMVDFLINNWSAGVNPSEKLKQLQFQRETIQKSLSEIDSEINKAAKQIALFGEWGKQKSNRKAEAIRILSRKIQNKEFEEAENIARTWQRICGVQALELLLEAKEKIERSGI